jgi:hypothetical protein
MKKEIDTTNEIWIFARPMIIGEDGTGYSREKYNVLDGNIIGEVAIWDWNAPQGTSPLNGGKLKVIQRTRQ